MLFTTMKTKKKHVLKYHITFNFIFLLNEFQETFMN